MNSNIIKRTQHLLTWFYDFWKTTTLSSYLQTIAKRVAASIAILCVASTLAACGASQAPASEAKPASAPVTPIHVVASLRQWGALASAIGGKYVQVSSIITEPNTDIAQAKPTSDQITTISKAQVVVSNGAGLDTWMQRYAGDDATFINAAQTVGAGKGDNPYLWFSSDVRKAMAQELVAEFSHIDSAHKSYYAKQLRAVNRAESKISDVYTTLQKLSKDTAASARMTYISISPIAQYLMSDSHFTDVTPQDIQQVLLTDDVLSNENIEQLQSMIEGRKAQVLVRTTAPSAASTDVNNLLAGIAGRSSVTLVDISPIMPADTESLADWILSLAQQLETIASNNTQTYADGNPSNEGQTDPEAGTGETSSNTQDSQNSQDTQSTQESQSSDGTVPSNEGQPNPR